MLLHGLFLSQFNSIVTFPYGQILKYNTFIYLKIIAKLGFGFYEVFEKLFTLIFICIIFIYIPIIC